MADFVAYYRVSTDQQGESGLGLDAQRAAVSRFVGGATVLAEFTEVESGKKHTNRPQLAAALAECKKRKATLIIATLDRLARNVHFISGLMDSGVTFVAADMPTASRFEIHIRAAMAEEERRKISERTKAALAVKRAQLALEGKKLGNPRLEEARAKAAEAHRNPPPPDTVEFIVKLRNEKQPLRKIVNQLNKLNIKTGRGSAWYASTVRGVLLQHTGAA